MQTAPAVARRDLGVAAAPQTLAGGTTRQARKPAAASRTAAITDVLCMAWPKASWAAATCAPAETTVATGSVAAGALSAVPGVDRVLREHTRRWNEAFEADGLHPDRCLLITRAADGATVAAIYEGGADPEELRHTRELLPRLSHGSGGV